MDTTDDVAGLLSHEQGRTQAVAQIIHELTVPHSTYGANPYTGVTINFEGLRTGHHHRTVGTRHHRPRLVRHLSTVGDTHLEGAWQVSEKPDYRYEIVERNHKMEGEYWGGYSRHNQLYQQVFDSQGRLIDDHLVVENHAMMTYAPFLETGEKAI